MASRPRYEIKSVSEIYSAEMLQAVGRLFLVCATAEMGLRYQLARLHHHPAPANINTLILISGMDIGVMLEKIVVGSMLINPMCRAEIDGLCDKIRSAFQRRNEIAHNSAIMGAQNHINLAFGKVTSAGRVTTEKSFHTGQLNEFSDQIEQTVRHLSERLNELGVAPLPEQLELATMTMEEALRPPQPGPK